MDDLVGTDRVPEVESHLASNKKNIELRYQMLIERSRQRLHLVQTGQLRAAEAAEWARHREGDLSARLEYSTTAVCPACGGPGLIEGEDVEDAEQHVERLSEDDYDAWMELAIGSNYFSCDRCRLVLDSYELIAEAKLPETFEVRTEGGSYWEPEYGND